MSVSAESLGIDTSIFLSEFSVDQSEPSDRVILNEILADLTLPRSAVFADRPEQYFRTPLNIVLADHAPEREFVEGLLKPVNAKHLDAWVKAPDTGFYPISYEWRAAGYPRLGSYNPDFFIRQGDHCWVIEIKDDGQKRQPAPENRAKHRAGVEHFRTLNERLQANGSSSRYHFHFLCPEDYDVFFSQLQERTFTFRSELDAAMQAPEASS